MSNRRLKASFSARAALLFLEIRRDSCEKSPCLTKKSASIRHSANFQTRPNPHDLVFCTEEGHCLDTKTLEEGFHLILSDLGLKRVNIHATRHTFATEALQKAGDIVTVSEILGHAKPSTTMDMYGHTFDERKRALMAQM